MIPIQELTDEELLAAITLARKLAWVSSIHRARLEDLKEEASHRKLKVS